MSFYKDFDSLQRMLRSLESYPFDMLIAIDGRYKGHTGKTPLSDKKTRDLFKTIQTPHILIDAPDISQIDKRQIYNDKSVDYDLDVLIVMDSDEFIVHEQTNWPIFIEELNSAIKSNRGTYIQGYSIPSRVNQKRYGNKEDYYMNVTRVLHRPYDLKYVDTHYDVRNKRTGVEMSYASDTTVLTHFVIGTDHKLRDEDYQDQRAKYEWYQYSDEENNENKQKRIDAFIKERDSKIIAK